MKAWALPFALAAAGISNMGAAQTASTAVTEPPAARLATATKIVTLMQIDRVVDTMFQQLTPTMTTSIFSAIEHAADAPTKVKVQLGDAGGRRAAETIMGEEIMKSFRARYPEIIAATAREYATSFTQPELDAILVFYQSPAGARLLELQPTMQAKLSEQGRKIGMAAGAEGVPRAIVQIEALPTPGSPSKR